MKAVAAKLGIGTAEAVGAGHGLSFGSTVTPAHAGHDRRYSP
jgi:hypothetical protein